MLNLAKSIHVNTRAESSSFACIFSLMALKVLGKLVYFLPSDDHTDYRSLCIVSEKDFLYTGLVFSGNWTHVFTTKI